MPDSVFVDLGLLVSGLALLTFGADWLVAGAARLALKWGVSALLVGLTIVAFGTSLPEFLVSAQSAFSGKSALAIGNVVGSNVCNLALIVGVAVCIRPFVADKQVVRREFVWMMAATVLLIAMLLGGQIVWWQGVILVAGLVLYTWRSWSLGRNSSSVEAEEDLAAELGDVQEKKPIWMLLGLICLGLGLLVVGSDLLVDGATSLARRIGVSEAIIGLSLVAFGTSLPELATTVLAAIRGQSQLALGNAVGSNIFNVFFVVGLSAVVAPSPLRRGEVSLVDLGCMLFVALLTWGMIASRGRKMVRLEGVALLLVYAGYLAWITLFR